MPIVIRHSGQFDVIQVVCDHCGEVIADARDGNYQWKSAGGALPEGGHLYFTHKACCHAFEEANRGDFLWAAMELQCLPIFLENNLKLDREAALRTVRAVSEL